MIRRGLLISLLLTVIFLWTYLINITKPLDLTHGDAFLVNFILKHWMDVLFSGDWTSLTTLPMFYGFENSLFFTDHHFVQAVLAVPFYLMTKDIITTSNLLVVTTIFLSLWSMYSLVWHFTKKVFPSMLGAIIFVLNPFIFARFPDQLILFSLQWIPMIFLFFEKSLDKSGSKNLFLFFFFLTCQLLSSLYYSVFLTIILPIYIVVRLWQKSISPLEFINRGAIIGLLLFVSVAIGSGALYYQVFSKYPINRSLEKTATTYSARVSDWFFTAPQNLVYGGLKEKAEKAFPSVVHSGIYSEQNLFWGIVPLILFLVSFFVLRKSSHQPLWLLSLCLLILSFLLSLGPKITFSDNFSIPGPYRLAYLIDPLLSYLRTSARFGVFVFFFLGIIASLTLAELAKRVQARRYIILSFVILILLIEYMNKSLAFTKIDSKTKNFYATLNSQKHIRVIVDIPIGNLIPYIYPQARAEDFDAHYLLWATVLHDKTLFNGYTGFLPQEYYKRGAYLSINFPTKEKLAKLREWGVDGIVVHKDEFNQTHEFDRIKSELKRRGVEEVASTDNLALFDLIGWKEAP